jgi:hypothetical protein
MSPEPLGPAELLTDIHRLDQFDSGMPELDRWLGHSTRVAAAPVQPPHTWSLEATKWSPTTR